MNNTVIACVDGSPSTRPVCEYAAWAAGKLGAPLALLHVLEKSETPAVSDLTGSIGIDSREQLTEALVRVEGERSRLLMAQGKAVLAGCAELLKQTGQPGQLRLVSHGAALRVWAISQDPIGFHLAPPLKNTEWIVLNGSTRTGWKIERWGSTYQIDPE